MNQKEIGLNIKAYRKKAKLTQCELAEIVGKTESSIRKYELGLVQIPTGVLEEIAKALNTSPFSLMGAELRDPGLETEGLSKEVQALEAAATAFGDAAMSILISYSLLNEDGRNKAADYISDLAEHPRYKKNSI